MSVSVSESRVERLCLKKDEYSDTRVYTPDASEIFSFKSGTVTLNLILPKQIHNGVYSKCYEGKYFGDYLLFSVNPAGKYIVPPGMYAALTPNGIEFTIWTSSGKYTIIDTTTDISASTQFLIDFCWDWSSSLLGSGAKMAIFVNEEMTVSSGSPISGDSIDNVEFTALDNAAMDYGTSCTLCDIVTYSSVPLRLRGVVEQLDYPYLGIRYTGACGRDTIKIWGNSWSDVPFVIDIGCNQDNIYSLTSCDSTGDIYVATFYDDGEDNSGSVSLVSGLTGKILKDVAGLYNPRCVAVTQTDGVDYPKITNTAGRPCPYVWIADQESIIITDHDLTTVSTLTGFSSPKCVVPTSDGRAWVMDTGNDRIVLISEGGASVVKSTTSPAPSMGGLSVRNELFVYGATADTVKKYEDGVEVKSITLASAPNSMAVQPNSGKVVLSFWDGTIAVYSRNLAFISSWSLGLSCGGICMRRGIGRESIIAVDILDSFIYEKSFAGVTIRRSELSMPMFNGSIVIPADNESTILISDDVTGYVSGDYGVIADVNAPQYKVDSLSTDLSGGRANEVHDKEDGSRRTDVPTDLRFGAEKGGRLPE